MLIYSGSFINIINGYIKPKYYVSYALSPKPDLKPKLKYSTSRGNRGRDQQAPNPCSLFSAVGCAI